MHTPAILRIAPVGLLVALALAGCFSRDRKDPELDCRAVREVEEYRRSVTVAPLDVPADLDAPEETRMMMVPEGPTTAGTRLSRCLERPPPYFRATPENGAAPQD